MTQIAIIHGPNLNLLGKREPSIYGSATLNEINQHLIEQAKLLGHTLETFQSNAEHELIHYIHEAVIVDIKFIIINPAALTHTSIALRDALAGVNIPFIEIHLSNPHHREKFRQHSYLADLAVGVIYGFGAYGYELAITAANHYLANKHEESSY